MNIPQDMVTQCLNDLRTVQPNMLDMAPSMMTRDADNHAPELGSFKKPMAKPVTNSNPLNVNQMIK